METTQPPTATQKQAHQLTGTYALSVCVIIKLVSCKVSCIPVRTCSPTNLKITVMVGFFHADTVCIVKGTTGDLHKAWRGIHGTTA